MEVKEDKIKIVRYASLSLRKWIPDEKDSATLVWSTRGLYPRITVYTSNNNAFVNSKPNYDYIITAPFDIITLQMFIKQLKNILKEPENTKYAIDCLNTKVENGVRTNEKYVQAKVHIGKDDNGVIYIAATEDNKKKIKFTLLPNMEFFKFYDKAGQLIKDNKILSALYTEAYIKSIETLLVTETLLLSKKEVDVDKPNITREKKPAKREYSDELSTNKEIPTSTTPATDPLGDIPEPEEPSKESDSNLDVSLDTPSDTDDFLGDDFNI